MSLSAFLVAFTTFFATVGPLDIVVVFTALTKGQSTTERRIAATRGVLIASGILLAFAFFGDAILSLFGITLPALRIAGGILLLLIAIDMVFARHTGGTGTTEEESVEARTREDISVFPLAMPLLAGPGAISAAVLLATGAGDTVAFWTVLAALIAVMVLAWLMLLMAIPVQRLLGVTGSQVVSRMVGILLAALAVQFVVDGLAATSLFAGS